MDLFKYTAAVKEIEMCNTVSGIEKLIRKYNDIIIKWPHEIKPADILYYKLYTLALNKFESRSKRILPEFLYTNRLRVQTLFLSSIFEYESKEKSYYGNTKVFNKAQSYEDFMDIFEFDKLLILRPSEWYVEKLNQIIGDKPVHFKVEFNYKNTPFDRYSTNLLQSQKTLLYAIRYKQVNFPDKPQTIWDMFIEDSRQEVLKHDLSELSTIDEQILKLKRQIKALESLEGYIHGK